MSKKINPVVEHIVKVIKAGNLTMEERFAVIQDLNLIKKHFSCDKMDLLTGLSKIVISESSITYIVKFNNYVKESIKCLREDLASRLMKPIFEAEDDIKKDISDNMEKGENESDADFKARMKDQEKIQGQNKDEFEKAQEKLKKGETKPLAKALRAKGMNQQELADRLDVHKSTISRIKTGQRKPSYDLMANLSDTFGSVENLFPELR